MDIEKVQPPQGLRVERTGSEQQRRRRRELQEAFDELLETTLGEEETEDKEGTEQEQRQPGTDTVSITNGLNVPTLINDYVSLSSLARQSVHEAAQRQREEQVTPAATDPQPSDPGPVEPQLSEDHEPGSQAAELETEEQPAGIDTLA
jgi:hypothetical protein